MTIHIQEKLSKIRNSFCWQCVMQCKMNIYQLLRRCEFGLSFWLGNITLPSVSNVYKTIQGATQTEGLSYPNNESD